MPASAQLTPSTASARALDELVGHVERASRLDPVSEAVAAALDRLLPTGRARDLASGVPIGHPAHPLLVALPIGAWTAASWLDLGRGSRALSRRLIGFGVAAAVPAVLTGGNDWLTTSGAERRVGLVHAALNSTTLALYGASWWTRRRGHNGVGILLSLTGLATTAAAGWLGGHLSYAMGVGVDTTAFQHLPAEWTDAAAEADLPDGSGLGVTVEGVPVLLVRHLGRLIALADRCTHRGGPLHEGEVADGCVTCPWHGSRFALADGSVRHGPASRPQPTLQTRVVAGRVQVRRAAEPRALRTNPAGV